MIAHEKVHAPLGISTTVRNETSLDFADVHMDDLSGRRHVYVTIRFIPGRKELHFVPQNVEIERACRILVDIADTLCYQGPDIMMIPDNGTDQCTIQIFCYPDRRHVNVRSENLSYSGTIQLINMVVAEINRKQGERNGS